MSSIALTNNFLVTAKEKPFSSGSNENFCLKIDQKDNSLTNTDNFSNYRSSDTYTFSRGLAAAAKTGIGIFAADQATQQIYKGQQDKRLHSLVGGAISGVAGEVTTALTGKKWIGILAGIGAGILAGGAKEVWDKQGHGTPDINDFYATSLGSLTVGASLTLPF